MSLGSDAFKKKLWTDRDYLMAIGYSTPYANLAGDTAAEYYVDLPGLFSTSTAPNILEIVNEAIRSRGMEELSQNRRAIQQYVAEEQPSGEMLSTPCAPIAGRDGRLCTAMGL